jgi:serine/threonine protein kinase
VYALKETDIGFCIVMEFVDGWTLSDMMKEQGLLKLEKTVAIFKQMLLAFDFAHRMGIIHRDIKPGNIMLTRDDRVKVTDFGLAKIQQSSAGATVTVGKIMGTIPYMSPEQAKGLGDIDNRSDIYSLGMTFYEALVGRLPFTADMSDLAILQAKVEGNIPPPDKFKTDLSKDLVRIVMKAIHKDPAKRYQTAKEMLDEIERVTSEEKTETKKTPSRSVLIAIAAILVLIISGYVLYVRVNRQEAVIPQATESPGQQVISVDSARGKNMSELTDTVARSAPPPSVSGTGTLVVRAVPSGSVSVAEMRKPSSSSQPASFELDPGHHTVVISNPGCGEKRISIEIQKGASTNLKCYFESHVNIQSLDESGDPFFGTIMVDGVNTGLYTPRSGYRLDCGKHTIAVTRVGYTTVEGLQEVNVQPALEEKTYELVFHLKTE